jgi:hypothetical protein
MPNKAATTLRPEAEAVASSLRRLDLRTRDRAADILRRLGHGETQSGFYGFAAGIEELARLGVPGVGALFEHEREALV